MRKEVTRGAGWDGRHFLGGGWLSLEASSLSERNSPGAPLPAPLPTRISPCPPSLQERRPAPICHPLCEGGSPGLGSGGLVRAALSRPDPLSTSGGPMGAVLTSVRNHTAALSPSSGLALG